LEWALASWVRQTRPMRDREPLALDGKVVRGAVTITQPTPHLLSVSTHQTHETRVCEKSALPGLFTDPTYAVRTLSMACHV